MPRYKRLAAAFEEGAKVRLCESSGSEHSPPMSRDLSDLVNSFIERQNGVNGDDDIRFEKQIDESDSELNETLTGLLGCGDDEISKTIRAVAELAYRTTGDVSSPDFKRRLMARLRERGFDAGLCKSKWERNGRFPSGSYEYIDVNISHARYIVEVNLAAEFKIARPTDEFSSLLELFPAVFVGKAEDLKQVVRLVCSAVKQSMNAMDMHVPPWRRYGYMKAKWFSSYKRTINEVPNQESDLEIGGGGGCKRSVGFVPFPAVSHNCREVFVGRAGGVKRGQLAMAMSATNSLLM